MIGTVLPGGTRIDEKLQSGTWSLYRGTAADGARALVTVVPQPPPEPSPAVVARELALPIAGIPRLLAIVDATTPACRALLEEAPAGTPVAALPAVPVDDAITIALDLARLLARVHAAGLVHGDLRPQTTFVERVAGRLTLTGTTPRCTRFGAPYMPATGTGWYSPFFNDLFLPDVLVSGKGASPSSDVAQLGMLIDRLVTGRSPFRDPDGNVVAGLMQAMRGETAAWSLDGARAAALEALAKATFDPRTGPERELAPLRAFLEQAA